MITVENLDFTYPKKTAPTLKKLNFHIQEGEIFGFLGPSGAGKSTTQNILINLLAGYGGKITVLGRDLKSWRSDYYQHIGVGFELPNHYARLTAEENLRFFASFYKKRTEDPMKLLGMVDLKQDARKKVSDYSKGMKMRLCFVRALLHDPDILFLDEPTGGLDPNNARVLKNIILEKKKAGKTILLTTHNMHDAQELCDRVAFIVDGEIKALDAPRTLMQHDNPGKVTVDFNDGQPRQATFPLEGLGDNGEFLNLLKSHTIKAIHSQEHSLEDVFIQITGSHLH